MPKYYSCRLLRPPCQSLLSPAPPVSVSHHQLLMLPGGALKPGSRSLGPLSHLYSCPFEFYCLWLFLQTPFPEYLPRGAAPPPPPNSKLISSGISLVIGKFLSWPEDFAVFSFTLPDPQLTIRGCSCEPLMDPTPLA